MWPVVVGAIVVIATIVTLHRNHAADQETIWSMLAVLVAEHEAAQQKRGQTG